MDAAQAFEALQAEVALQRRAIEALGEALDGMLEGRSPPDLSVDTAQILKGQAQLLKSMEVLKAHPALAMTPAEHHQAVAQAGSAFLGDAAQQLRQATQGIERERWHLANLLGVVAFKDRQRQLLLWTAGAALTAGLLLSPVLVRLLPVELSSHVAALLVNEDRWQAGALLMELAHTGQWPGALEAMRLAHANEPALSACRAQAAKTGREQRCTITMPAQ